jgi:hypothetical protein
MKSSSQRAMELNGQYEHSRNRAGSKVSESITRSINVYNNSVLPCRQEMHHNIMSDLSASMCEHILPRLHTGWILEVVYHHLGSCAKSTM